MKTLLTLAIGALLFTGLASADTCTSAPVALSNSLVYTCGSVTLSDFVVNNADGGSLATNYIVSGSIVDGEVFIQFNPQLSPETTTDEYLFFTVSGVSVVPT